MVSTRSRSSTAAAPVAAAAPAPAVTPAPTRATRSRAAKTPLPAKTPLGDRTNAQTPARSTRSRAAKTPAKPAVVEEPVVEVEEPVVEAEEPVVETEEPVVETVAETPEPSPAAAKTPVVKTPVAKTPVAKTPVAKTPVAKTPVAKTPVAKTPVAKTPVAQATPAAEEQDTDVEMEDEAAATAAAPIKAAYIRFDDDGNAFEAEPSKFEMNVWAPQAHAMRSETEAELMDDAEDTDECADDDDDDEIFGEGNDDDDDEEEPIESGAPLRLRVPFASTVVKFDDETEAVADAAAEDEFDVPQIYIVIDCPGRKKKHTRVTTKRLSPNKYWIPEAAFHGRRLNCNECGKFFHVPGPPQSFAETATVGLEEQMASLHA